MTCFTLCQECDTPIAPMEDPHQAHEADCDRFVTAWCRCDLWVCASCCKEPECSPLVAALQEAREEVRSQAEFDEALHELSEAQAVIDAMRVAG